MFPHTAWSPSARQKYSFPASAAANLSTVHCDQLSYVSPNFDTAAMINLLSSQLCVPSSASPSWSNPNLWPTSCATVDASAASLPFRTMEIPVEAMEQQFSWSMHFPLTCVQKQYPGVSFEPPTSNPHQ